MHGHLGTVSQSIRQTSVGICCMHICHSTGETGQSQACRTNEIKTNIYILNQIKPLYHDKILSEFTILI
jgi:hypothetical protein